MAYSTVADIALSEQDLIDLTDDTDSGAVDAAILAAEIDRADRLIDSYLRGRYHTPFDPVPPEIVELSAALTKYNLYDRRGLVDDIIRRDRDDRVSFLKDLTADRARLDETGQPADIDRSPSRIVTNKTSNSRMFPPDVLNKW